jgi:peptide/nickel transport system permease protein
MLTLILRRLVLSIVTVAMVSVVVFAITEILPGDIATAYLGRDATPERVAQLRTEAGLDKPVGKRFLYWTGNVLRGDFGISFARKKPVSELLRVRFRNTILMSGAALLIGIPLGIILGIFAALAREHFLDAMFSSIALAGMSIPRFVIAILLTYVFSIELKILPAVSSISADAPVKELLPGIILPCLTLALTIVAPILSIVRTRMSEVMISDFVQMAKLRGVPYARVIWRYALPNAMLPMMHLLALMTASILSGVVIIEAIFNYPGLGTLAISAIHDRDVPLLQGVAMLSAVICILINLIADWATLALNPKLRTRRI